MKGDSTQLPKKNAEALAFTPAQTAPPLLLHLPNLLTRHPLPAPRCPPPEFVPSNAFSAGRRHWFFPIRNFSSQTGNPSATANSVNLNPEKSESDEDAVAKLFSDELQKNPDSEPLPLQKRLDLSFSHVRISPAMLLSTLNLSPDAGRMALDFLKWAKSRPGFEPSDEVYSHFVAYFGRRKDFKATHEVLVDGLGVAGVKSLEALIDRMVRAGMPSQTVALFERMEKDYGFVRDMDSLKLIVSGLCNHGYASYAEKLVKGLANEFFPDEYICDALIEGWCVDGKLDEAKRLLGEMQRGGFEIGTYAYNAILECVCTLCRKKDPFRLDSESRNVLVEMERNGVPCDVETFNVLITNYCKIRKTSVALELFSSCQIGEGDEMIDRMKSAGFGDALDTKAYYEFLKILCGIERVDHAMNVFAMMKEDGRKPGIKSYDLLMGKLCAHGRLDKANALYKEAESSGLAVQPKAYKVDPRFVKKKDTAVKKEKKRETLPEKMARKRRRLKQIRLSFVKKPKKMRRRAC
ncbi:hypothetical protein SASPL_136316 [Salvia splendens]|uniref:Pentatricopeptide repeat-containing protein PNM1, mitochondrial n=1 Tax=Salvia splendens TaxID=180675 RepID=A0A8X8WZL0_SALSN|nr:hypothetical protein SASPL_136316 [Salvia splendens]